MAMHIKTIRGHEYAYDVTTVWNKDEKKYKKISKYLGVITDHNTKTYERRYNTAVAQEKLILDYGDTYLISETAKASGLKEIFETVTPKERDTLWTLLCYKIIENFALMYAQVWYQGNYISQLYSNAVIASQRITEFLKRLGNEKIWREFFTLYLKYVKEKECGIIIDSTGMPNEIEAPISQYGSHGGEVEQETRLIMVVDQVTKTPLYFRYVAGNIADVSTLQTTVKELAMMGVKASFALLDAGYFSEANIREMYNSKIEFLTRMPSGRVLYKTLINETAESIEKAVNLVIYNKRSLYIERKAVDLFGNEGYAYIVFDVKRKGDEMNKYLMMAREDKIENSEMDYEARYKGKFILVSNKKLSTDEVIPLYYTRQSAERIFCMSKTNIDLLPLRSHSEASMRGILLLNFMALVLYIQMQKKLGSKYTVEAVLLEARNLKCKVFDDALIISEPNKRFKVFCSLLDVTVPNCSGI